MKTSFKNKKVEAGVVIAKHPGYQISHHQPAVNHYPGKIVITFGIIHGGLKRVGFGTEFLNKLGIENLYVAHSKRSFYQQLSAEALYAHVAPLVRDKKVYTYGSSLGAYAALYYAGILNAKALALSPICSADPKLKPPKNKYPPFLHQPFEQITRSEHLPLIAYDPLIRRDNFYVENVISKAYPDAHKLVLPNGMHSVSLSLQASGQLKAFFMHGLLHEGVPDIKIDPLLDRRYCLVTAKKALQTNDIPVFQEFFSKALAMGQSLDLFKLAKDAFYAKAFSTYPDALFPKAFVLAKLQEKRISQLSNAKTLAEYFAADINYYSHSMNWDLALERLDLACSLTTEAEREYFEIEKSQISSAINFYNIKNGQLK